MRTSLSSPAREGALRVLRAAANAGVKRVVLTSSFAAIGYGQDARTAPFDETCWTNPAAKDLGAYTKSKTIAERAAWDFVATQGKGMELAVVNPVGVFGPVLGPDYSTSILLVQRLMNGSIPGLPKLTFGAVDVRDVADLHIRAMTDPKAAGERFLAVAGDFMTMQQIAQTLKARMGEAAAKVPTREIPSWILRLIALGDPAVKTAPARTRQDQERHQRQGAHRAQLGAALQRRVDRGHCGKPEGARASLRAGRPGVPSQSEA